MTSLCSEDAPATGVWSARVGKLPRRRDVRHQAAAASEACGGPARQPRVPGRAAHGGPPAGAHLRCGASPCVERHADSIYVRISMARSIAEAGCCCLSAASRNADMETCPVGRAANACLGHVLLLQPGGKEANFRLREHASSSTSTRPCSAVECFRLRARTLHCFYSRICVTDPRCHPLYRVRLCARHPLGCRC